MVAPGGAYGSEQSLVKPQLRQVILQLRSYIRKPQISQSRPSSLCGCGGFGIPIGWVDITFTSPDIRAAVSEAR